MEGTVKMKVWVADEIGKIKSCILEKSTTDGGPLLTDTKPVPISEEHNRSDYVQIMTHAKWETPNKILSGVAIARRGGSLQIIDSTSGETLWSRHDHRVKPDDMFVALEVANNHLFWCTNHGYFGFAPLTEANDADKTCSLKSGLDLEELKLEGPIQKARCHPRFLGVFAFGGKDVNLEVWRPSTQESQNLNRFHPTWTAKNVRNDMFNLKQPIWVSDLHFLDEQRRPLDLGFLLVICTRFHQVRVYDTRLSRRPILDVEIGSSPLVSMVLGTNDNEVIFADSHGTLTSFSLDKCTSNGDFVGPTGNVLSLDVNKSIGEKGVLACVGLDRFLRLFDISTKRSIGTIYCKTKMTSVLIIEGSLGFPRTNTQSAKRKTPKEASSLKAGDDKSDSVWTKLPEIAAVGNAVGKRRRIQAKDRLAGPF